MKNLARMAALAAAVCMLIAAVASSASAEVVNGKYNSTTVKLSGSNLTVKKNGADPRTCQLAEVSGTISGSNMSVYNKLEFGSPFTTELTCTGGGMRLALRLYLTEAKYDTVTEQYSLKALNQDTNTVSSPWGYYYWGYGTGNLVNAGWTNGSGATHSTINFNETEIGRLSSNLSTKLTLTGSLKATTGSGGLLTMSH